jgi:septum site-determining protein MinC
MAGGFMVVDRQLLHTEGRCFRFKASFSPCLILEILRNDFPAIQKELAEMAIRTPKFFTGSAVAIDLEKIPASEKLDFEELKKLLQLHGLIPVGIRGGNEEQKDAAAIVGLQSMHPGKSSSLELIRNQPEAALKREETKIISTPIRSGMQLHAREGDLIVTSQVSPGAELVAAGHIHIYGALRGRALAGAYGNQSARIFCRTLEAELVSIAGYYLTKDEMSPIPVSSGMIQIVLENETLQIKAL